MSRKERRKEYPETENVHLLEQEEEKLPKDFVGIITNSPFVNIRRFPDANSSIMDTLQRGAEVRVIDEEGDFFKILFEKEKSIGYISKSYIVSKGDRHESD